MWKVAGVVCGPGSWSKEYGRCIVYKSSPLSAKGYARRAVACGLGLERLLRLFFYSKGPKFKLNNA